MGWDETRRVGLDVGDWEEVAVRDPVYCIGVDIGEYGQEISEAMREALVLLIIVLQTCEPDSSSTRQVVKS